MRSSCRTILYLQSLVQVGRAAAILTSKLGGLSLQEGVVLAVEGKGENTL